MVTGSSFNKERMNSQGIGERYMMRVSVVIPTINAEKQLDSLLTMLEKQTIRPDEILIIDSSSADHTVSVAKAHSNVRIEQIPREAYNHGKTRDLGVQQTVSNIILFFTQDAVPADEKLIENLMKPVQNPNVAVVYARQIPREDSSLREKLVREYNYPPKSRQQSEEDIQNMGIKAFFCSNVCAAYRRDVYETLGGFEKDLLSNEDMIYAAHAIRNGYRIAYAADAAVIHSHDLSLREQYRRNWVQGYEIARHQELLGNASSSREGFHMLRIVSAQLLKQGRCLSVFGLIADCAARYLGSRAGGKRYHRSEHKEVTT